MKRTEQKFGVALNHHQKIVKVMSNAACEPPHRFHLLGLAQLLFKLLALTDVLCDHKTDAPLGVFQLMRNQFDFENAPIFCLVPPLATVKSSYGGMAPDVVACSAIAHRTNVKHCHSLELFLRKSVLSNRCVVHFQKFTGFRIKNPCGKRCM